MANLPSDAPSIERPVPRRSLFALGAALGAGLLTACSRNEATEGPREPSGAASQGAAAEESPIEDLMAEHGVLGRLLLVYEESLRRLQGQPQPELVETISNTAGLVRRFVEDYHEKLEEDFLFPRFEKARVHHQLVAVLRRQHEAGRALTDDILKHATGLVLGNVEARTTLSMAMQSFVRMYRPHEAREDSVLFPAFRRLVTPKEYAELGERFETMEHQRFGREGRLGIVRQVEALEQQVQVADLDAFTPR